VNPSQYVAQQTLHGYRDGHRLLQASLRLPQADDLELLTQSDNSDATSRGFSEILAGYPLPSGQWYALSMTWPAPELERPGCVWTHTLLLDLETLVGVEEPAAITNAFRRPVEADRHRSGSYTEPLKLDPKLKQNPSVPQSLLPTTLWALYEPPRAGVNVQIPSLKPSVRRGLLLALWAQQWPELRMTFSFAEAPGTARRLGQRLFDIQVTERPNRSSWFASREDDVRTVTGATNVEPPAWSQALAQDVVRPGPLRRFLWIHGPETEADLKTLPVLAEVWVLLADLESADNVAALFGTLGTAFPEPEQAGTLKRALLRGEESEDLPAKIPEGAILAALVRGAPQGFSLHDLALGRRAQNLVRSQPLLAADAVDAIPLRGRSEAAEEIIDGFVAGLSDRTLAKWPQGREETLARLVTLRPELATRPAVWVRSDATSLWAAIRVRRPQLAVRRAIIEALLSIDDVLPLEMVLESWHEAALSLAKNLEEPGVQASVRARFVRALPKKVLIKSVQQSPPGPRMAQAILESRSGHHLDGIPVAKLSSALEAGGVSRKADLALVRLFSHAVASSVAKDGLVAIQAYRVLYPRAARGNLGERAKGELASSRTPASELAIRLSEAYRRRSWPTLDLTEILEPEAFGAVLKADGEAKIARDLAVQIPSSHVPITRWQRDRILAIIESDSDPEGLRKVLRVLWRLIPR
jgi:GTPase-associated protein 1, N-terminal domain type 1